MYSRKGGDEMIKKQIADILVLKASKGCYLTQKDNPDVRATEIWVAKNDDPANYIEVKEVTNE